MVSRVLVPLDGSTLAEGVLPYARQLSSAMKLKVEVLEVLAPSRAKASAEQYLKTVSKYFASSGVTPTVRVAQGVPAAVILEDAASVEGTLTAMSTHGRSGLGRWLIGSVAEKVLHSGEGPFLFDHPAPRSPIAGEPKLTRVIVPFDGSDTGEKIIPDIVAMAKAMALEAVLVQVTPSVSDLMRDAMADNTLEEASAASYQEYVKIVEEGNATAKAYLADLQKRVKAQGVSKVTTLREEGDAAEVINELATEEGSFVAMTTRGRTGLARMVLGSVADRVVRHCGSPVYLVRPA